MTEEAVIVLDCGATNLRAIAVDRSGNILAGKSFQNHTVQDPHLSGGLIWDTEYILDRLTKACRHVCEQIKGTEIKGICTTSFGVDGAPYDKNGKQLYPVISWACERTKDIMHDVHEIIPLQELHSITGLNRFHFNTLYKLYWLQQNRKDILDRTKHWLFMPSIVSGFLCKEHFTDVSMMGTSMLCDRNNRTLSKEIFSSFGFEESWFPVLKEAGEMVGTITAEVSGITGIPEETPVFAAGHDTQSALYGSGAGINEPILSSGTWEILMVRTPEVYAGCETLDAGITTELDAVPGLFNPGMQWLGSKYIEKVRREQFSNVMHRKDIYDIMISEARSGTERGMIFYKLLRDLSQKTRDSLLRLEKSCGFKAETLMVVGGGSKNQLWNQLREEVLGMKVIPIPQAETTVLGAAKILFERITS